MWNYNQLKMAARVRGPGAKTVDRTTVIQQVCAGENTSLRHFWKVLIFSIDAVFPQRRPLCLPRHSARLPVLSTRRAAAPRR